jgi:hypothetical protein
MRPGPCIQLLARELIYWKDLVGETLSRKYEKLAKERFAALPKTFVPFVKGSSFEFTINRQRWSTSQIEEESQNLLVKRSVKCSHGKIPGN